MTAGGTTSVLGLAAALIWGAADFSGGIAAKYLRVYWLLAVSHAASLLALLLLAFLMHQPCPGLHILAWGLLSGLAGGTALLTFYYALSLGGMGITASVTGLLTAALPVAFTLITLGEPSQRQLAGFVIAAGAIWLISSQPPGANETTAEKRKKLILATIAGIGFGSFLIALHEANSGGLLWPLAASRAGSLTVALGGGLLFSRGKFTTNRNEAAPLPVNVGLHRRWGLHAEWKIGVVLALVSSVFDTSGNFFFVAATRVGRLDVAAMLSSLYPASTIVLAAWLLKERTSPRQAIGMTAALAAVALIS